MTELSARRSATRDRLIEAAMTVFAERGVGGATVEVICEAAGFTRGAFYSNFDSKDTLCLAVLSAQAQQNLAATEGAIAGLSDEMTTASVDDLVGRAVQLFLSSQRHDLTWVMAASELRLYAAREASLRPEYVADVAHMSELFATMISEAAAQCGLTFILPPLEAVSVLQAVYEHTTIMGLIEGAAPDSPAPGDRLAAVFRSMLRPLD